MTNEELIAALSSAPTGTRELGVAVLEAAGATVFGRGAFWAYWEAYGEKILPCGHEARVVTDINFRLPGVPEGTWFILGVADSRTGEQWRATLSAIVPGPKSILVTARAHTEALARCIVQLKAVLAAREKV